eukprot:9337739-Pyramimonas_sp.AAC.1
MRMLRATMRMLRAPMRMLSPFTVKVLFTVLTGRARYSNSTTEQRSVTSKGGALPKGMHDKSRWCWRQRGLKASHDRTECGRRVAVFKP